MNQAAKEPSKEILRENACRSAAATLSDMEMFLFPELLYSLVLANILSPRLWRWREEEWFDGYEEKSDYRRISRLKQYIMDHYIFNLDLETWGLTDKQTELERFSPFMDEETLAQSNALFGYEGDKYYFDLDIRTHFGLDKYDSDIIPYWKTETIEAMDAFRFKAGYEHGAGECVSLSALYAAALFVVARIPLEKIYLMATPLHSQNFVAVDDGILTNNRRLVTKNMWFNGSALSAKARRALESEHVTYVTHESGWIHKLYAQATISEESWSQFSQQLTSFLHTPLTSEVLCNYLRHDSPRQKCFQMRCLQHGVAHYIALDRVFHYEHGSPYRVSDNTRDKLMNDIDDEEYQHCPLAERVVLNDLEASLEEDGFDLETGEGVKFLRAQTDTQCMDPEAVLQGVRDFCCPRPRLPGAEIKQFNNSAASLGLTVDMSREEMLAHLEGLRGKNRTADLAFYTWRDLSRTEVQPFVRAALERNPVCLNELQDTATGDVVARLRTFADESIYAESGRFAQPDEVWNFQRGDGAEKAVLLANLLSTRSATALTPFSLHFSDGTATLQAGAERYEFPTGKEPREKNWDLAAMLAPYEESE